MRQPYGTLPNLAVDLRLSTVRVNGNAVTLIRCLATYGICAERRFWFGAVRRRNSLSRVGFREAEDLQRVVPVTAKWLRLDSIGDPEWLRQLSWYVGKFREVDGDGVQDEFYRLTGDEYLQDVGEEARLLLDEAVAEMTVREPSGYSYRVSLDY
jgi:hypothetical protein